MGFPGGWPGSIHSYLYSWKGETMSELMSRNEFNDLLFRLTGQLAMNQVPKARDTLAEIMAEYDRLHAEINRLTADIHELKGMSWEVEAKDRTFFDASKDASRIPEALNHAADGECLDDRQLDE